MSAWTILIGNSTVPASSIAWDHLNNQAGGSGGDVYLTGGFGIIANVNETVLLADVKSTALLIDIDSEAIILDKDETPITIETNETTT